MESQYFCCALGIWCLQEKICKIRDGNDGVLELKIGVKKGKFVPSPDSG